MESGVLNILDMDSPDENTLTKVIKPAGNLDESNVDKLSQQIYSIIEKHPDNLNLIFDLADLMYMNSKAIGYLTDWYQRISAKGGKIIISGASENILEILRNVGLLEFIETYSTFDEAKEHIFS